MKSRAPAVALAAAFFLIEPGSTQADKPIDSGRAGYVVEDNTCPAATHVLLDYCMRRPETYLVIKRVKGLKRYQGKLVVVDGPIDTTSCSRPLMDVRQINLWLPEEVEPCP